MALSDNLVVALEMDEASGNAIDSLGANDGTETSGTIATGTGLIYATARDFEAGDTEFFSVADHADVSLGENDRTFMIWCNPESVTGNPVLFSKGGAGAAREYICYLASGKPQFEVRSSGSNPTASWSGAALSNGTWYLITCKHDAAANSISVNVNASGSPNTAATGGAGADTASALEIGASSSQSLYWDGLLQSFQIYQRITSGAEDTELYNSGSGRTFAYITGAAGGGANSHYYRHMESVVAA